MSARAMWALAALAVVVGCGPPKQPASVLADDSVAPTNKGDVQSYPDAVAINEKQYIEWKAAPVRSAHPDGRLVAILTRGNPVAKVMRRGDYFLITFPNPDDPSKRWSGWVHKNVFVPGTEPYPPLGNPQRCQSDADCGAMATCNGVSSTGPSGLDGFRFCSGKEGGTSVGK